MVDTLTATKLFGRALSLVIGAPANRGWQNITGAYGEQGLDISGFDFEFVVEKSLKPTEPNTCSIKVKNLASDTRQQLSGAPYLTVQLSVGYGTTTSQIYLANVRAAWSTREGATYTTHIESNDTNARPTGLKKSKKQTTIAKITPRTIDTTIPTGTVYNAASPKIPVKDAFKLLAGAMGVGNGNIDTALATATLPITSVNGGALCGNSAKCMTNLCRSTGFEWSIQDMNLQLLPIGGGTTKVPSLALDLSSSTGIVNSPSVDSQGVLSVQTLLIPGLAPGVLVTMDSLFTSGAYRIEKIRYTGTTYGTDWYAHLVCAKY